MHPLTSIECIFKNATQLQHSGSVPFLGFGKQMMHHSQSQRRWKPESHRHWEFWIGLFVCIMTIQLLGITSGKYQTYLVCAQWKHPCSMHVSGLIIFYSSNLWLPQVHLLCQHAHDPLRVPTEPTPSEEVAMVQLVSTGVHLKLVQISIETLLITRFFSKLDVSTIHEILPDIKHHVPNICLKMEWHLDVHMIAGFGVFEKNDLFAREPIQR